MVITSNPSQLKPHEISILAQAKVFTYWYGTGSLDTDNNVLWDCTNSAAAKEYMLTVVKARELTDKERLNRLKH